MPTQRRSRQRKVTTDRLHLEGTCAVSGRLTRIPCLPAIPPYLQPNPHKFGHGLQILRPERASAWTLGRLSEFTTAPLVPHTCSCAKVLAHWVVQTRSRGLAAIVALALTMENPASLAAMALSRSSMHRPEAQAGHGIAIKCASSDMQVVHACGRYAQAASLHKTHARHAASLQRHQ